MRTWLLLLLCLASTQAFDGRETVLLNGQWDFEQTLTAFPPGRFSRVIPVPGLIHLAEPRIEQYELFFQRPDTVENVTEFDLSKLHYQPHYNWYRRSVFIPQAWQGREVVLQLKKSMYVTRIFVNGHDVGGSMACYTPIDCQLTGTLKYGAENEILIRCGDRAWLPSQAAGGTDKEKVNYLPGIWDDVTLSCTGKLRLHRVLLLPQAQAGQVLVKIQVRSFYPSQLLYGVTMWDSAQVRVTVREKTTGLQIGAPVTIPARCKRDNLTELMVSYPMPGGRLWSPEDPFLYEAQVTVAEQGQNSDEMVSRFGFRDFSRDGKNFILNGKRYPLRGTNITLHRFFEDPECNHLPWDRPWVTRLLADIPKSLHWNAMRICVGIAPDFWYDIADSCGLLLQNEWLYWQNHGWDEQIRSEYTDWVWSDGHHPSIAIWDAINENWDAFIGNVLIPDLKKLDPTRIWDAGYMTGAEMALDEMDEPHPYMGVFWGANLDEYSRRIVRTPYRLGDLQQWPQDRLAFLSSSAAQLVNEYGWIWLWRDGRPAKLTLNQFDFFVGKKATPHQRRELQAYWLQLETEWLRAERSFAGVLAFCYLTNNYGFTGDWFIGRVQDLEQGPTLKWFRHAFAPTAVFIDLADGRYLSMLPPLPPATNLPVNLVGVNDLDHSVSGTFSLQMLDAGGTSVWQQQGAMVIPLYGKRALPISITTPKQSGGYLLLLDFRPDGSTERESVKSRRFLRIGKLDHYDFYDYPLQ